ncbi:hypothetical protein [Algihabitans albus]|uniref:hypothetical protein n=1 Tax=Algihabitans albus TaxID=2164067 RepID=UPI0013C33D78|nr:hypothetical protein [Algihabitans albus]
MLRMCLLFFGLFAAAGLSLAPAETRAAAGASTEKPAEARTLACFLLNSMTRSAVDLERREELLQAAISTGCLGLPEASPFRGGKLRKAQAVKEQADLERRRARDAADPEFRQCLLWAYTGYPSGLEETRCGYSFELLPSGFGLTCEAYLKEGFPTALDHKACQQFWRDRLKASDRVAQS